MIRMNDLWPEPARERTPRRSLLVTLPAWGSLASMAARCGRRRCLSPRTSGDAHLSPGGRS